MIRLCKMLLRIGLVSLILSGCGGVQIKDHVVFGDKGRHGATAVHTLFTDIAPVHIPLLQWNAMRLGMACISVDDLSQIQQTIDELCTKHTGACNYAVQQKIAAAFRQMRHAMAEAMAAGATPASVCEQDL
jgi:hypothetical protein